MKRIFLVLQLLCLLFAHLSSQVSLPFNIVHEFPLDTWVENLVVRQTDGSIVCTLLTTPDVYLVDPGNGRAVQVASIPGVLSVLGIVELGLDVFYVAAGNFSLVTFKSTPGSYSVWEVDLRGCGYGQKAKISEVATFPISGILNGMTVLNPVEGLVLIADSGLGVT